MKLPGQVISHTVLLAVVKSQFGSGAVNNKFVLFQEKETKVECVTAEKQVKHHRSLE